MIKKVYGPYSRKNDRHQHVVIVYENGKKRTVSYPKFLVEKELGRELDPDLETVDHIDGNPSNNDLSNLRILSRKQHATEDAIRNIDYEIDTACVWCSMPMKEKATRHNMRVNEGAAGPFCSKRCSGQYGFTISQGEKHLPVAERLFVEKKKLKHI